MPQRILDKVLEYATRFSSYKEDKAFFFGVSHETINKLFKEKTIEVDKLKLKTTDTENFISMARTFVGATELNEELGTGALVDLCKQKISELILNGKLLEDVVNENKEFFSSDKGLVAYLIKDVKFQPNYEDRAQAIENIKQLISILGIDKFKSDLQSIERWLEAPKESLMQTYIKDYFKKAHGVEIESNKLKDIVNVSLAEAVKEPEAEYRDAWIKMLYGTEPEKNMDGLLYYIVNRANKAVNDNTQLEIKYQATLLTLSSFDIALKIEPEIGTRFYGLMDILVCNNVELVKKALDAAKIELRERMKLEIEKAVGRVETSKPK